MTGLIWGFIKSIDAILLGNTGVKLGAGRAMASDKISFEVGFRLLKTIGQQIAQGIIFYYWILINQPKIQKYLFVDRWAMAWSVSQLRSLWQCLQRSACQLDRNNRRLISSRVTHHQNNWFGIVYCRKENAVFSHRLIIFYILKKFE